jgi:hypothetical protein
MAVFSPIRAPGTLSDASPVRPDVDDAVGVAELLRPRSSTVSHSRLRSRLEHFDFQEIAA